SRTRDSGNRFKYGDCSSCVASACLRVPSNTPSPVVFTKSVRSTESFSVSFAEWLERKTRNPPTSAASTSPPPTYIIVRDFLTGVMPTLVATGCADAEEAADAGPDKTTVTGIGDELDEWGAPATALSCATGTEPELIAAARPVSVSRFRRCRSARISAAC